VRPAADEFDPSLILSDFTLPCFDGMSALRIAQEMKPEVPFVFFSGTIGEERRHPGPQGGAVDYVLKGQRAPLVNCGDPRTVERATR